MEDSLKFKVLVVFFGLCFFICKRNNDRSEREKEKSTPVSSFQSRGMNAPQVFLWNIFNHVFGVAPQLFFSLESMKMCNA